MAPAGHWLVDDDLRRLPRSRASEVSRWPAGPSDRRLPTPSGHFAVLKQARRIHGDRQVTTIVYSLNVWVLQDALLALLERFAPRA